MPISVEEVSKMEPFETFYEICISIYPLSFSEFSTFFTRIQMCLSYVGFENDCLVLSDDVYYYRKLEIIRSDTILSILKCDKDEGMFFLNFSQEDHLKFLISIISLYEFEREREEIYIDIQETLIDGKIFSGLKIVLKKGVETHL